FGAAITSCHSGDSGAGTSDGGATGGGVAQGGGAAQGGGMELEEDVGVAAENDPIITTSDALDDAQIATILSDIIRSMSAQADLAVQSGSAEVLAFGQQASSELSPLSDSLTALLTDLSFEIEDSQLRETLQSAFDAALAQLQAET